MRTNELIAKWLNQDETRVKALQCARQLDLPQCYLAAGFVRNLVWDHLHGYSEATPLNDVDVVYFGPDEDDPKQYLVYERQLTQMLPECQWQVRNQALMHLRNGDSPYRGTLDAMSYWPEKETAVGVRLDSQGEYQCIAAFGFESLFALQLTPNPKRPYSLFAERVSNKNWLEHWPKLVVNNQRPD
ncbi:nucleotidyltransferase family protein [Photobacterium rosenbergii]|uniref:nucleotidyltransferase family protein n=1 Tax=Photobacterium rosenbergii TaxID=294936 RepID=UPI001C9978F6|nr:nucleotidyltransferase family protein [Photobacterium rosenbergii]MBY5945158.1 nucleotidyltransferase family protein [Photobacterium rosenbergii]